MEVQLHQEENKIELTSNLRGQSKQCEVKMTVFLY